MIDPHLTDRIPEVARGESNWSPEESGHLTSCASCTAEWDVVSAALRSQGAVPSIDVERVSSAVLARLRPPTKGLVIPVKRSRWRWQPLVGMAAALVMVVGLARTLRRPAPADTPNDVSAAESILPELDELQPQELEVLLSTMDHDPKVNEPLGVIPRLGDLTDEELAQLIPEVEG